MKFFAILAFATLAATGASADPLIGAPQFDARSFDAPLIDAPLACQAGAQNDLVLVDGATHTPMRYINPQIRTAARAMGFGGVAQYAVLRGPRATMRLANNHPTFVLAAPTNVQPESYFTLASFAVRRNGTREVVIGAGYMSYSSGISNDRVIATTATPAASQAGAPAGFTLYQVTPAAPLAPGEYAMVIYGAQTAGGPMAVSTDKYFDFGVD